MESTSFKFLHNEILSREFPLGSSIYEFLHPDRKRALETFARLIKSAEREFSYHFPVTLIHHFDSIQLEGYTFTDNFDAYLAGNIREDEIELVPEAIALMMSGPFNYPTANTWIYRKPHLSSVGGVTWCKYYTYHPVRYAFSPDGDFTEDSKVYYIPESDNTFINLVAYNVLNYLKQTRESVIQPTGVQFFDFSQRLQDLRASINDDFSTSAEVYEMWHMG